MVEERKETTQVKTALKQLESTVDQLLANGRKVTDTVIIMTKLARSEQRRYYVDPRTHELRSKDSSHGIRILTVQEPVRLYFRHELARVIEELRGAKWDSA
jgi:chromosome segregation and condensation protein ScpB